MGAPHSHHRLRPDVPPAGWVASAGDLAVGVLEKLRTQEHLDVTATVRGFGTAESAYLFGILRRPNESLCECVVLGTHPICEQSKLLMPSVTRSEGDLVQSHSRPGQTAAVVRSVFFRALIT